MKKTIEKKKPEIHRGFVSLEIMGALVIVAMAALFGAEKYSDYLDEQEWKVTATHASQFNEAAKQYIADHRDELLNNPLPYRITPSLLIKNGYLQQGFAEKNGLGQQYVTGVVKNSLKNPPALQALTCSVQGDTLSEKGMRRIAAQINGMGGYVDEKNIATGAYGGWKSQPRDFGLDCRHGHLAIALSSEILGSFLQESDRLYRFQVKHRPELNRMHTDIDMGSNSLNNANQINAENDITTRSGWLVTQDNKGWMNSTYGGGFYMSDDEWIRAVNNKNIYTGGELKGGTVRADERLSTGEFLQLDKVVIEGTSCPANGLVSRDAKGALLSCQSGMWGSSTARLQTLPGSTCPATEDIVPVMFYVDEGYAWGHNNRHYKVTGQKWISSSQINDTGKNCMNIGYQGDERCLNYKKYSNIHRVKCG